jgi:ectoine hydroxylase-related dioxygenase (phytanoyl-CoA dioxygenase family)
MTLTEDDLNTYRERGYWISPVLYTSDEIAELREAVMAVCSGERQNGHRYWLGDGPPEFDPSSSNLIQICNAWYVNDRMKDAVTDPRLGVIGAQLAGTDEVRLWHDQAIYKPGVGAEGVGEQAGNVGWHQDYAHWQCADTDNFVTAWVALQDTDLTNGGMRTIVGSHKWGLAGNAYTFGEKNLEELEERFKKDGQEWIDEPCVLKAGQVSFHHALTFHGSGPNLSNEPRLSFIVHMMPETCALNDNGRYHQNVDMIGGGRKVGDRFDGPAFPVVWSGN